MTNKDFLLQELQKETGLSNEMVFSLFEIMNKYDWAVFCSQMGDYDHPEERVQAKKVLDEELKVYSEESWKKVWGLLEESGDIHNFYFSNFHNMDKEKE